MRIFRLKLNSIVFSVSFLFSFLFLLLSFDLYSINLPQVLRGTPQEQLELKAISLANTGKTSEAFVIYKQLISSTKQLSQKEKLQQNLLTISKLEASKTSNPIPYLKELQNILNTYSTQKKSSTTSKESKSHLLDQAVSEYQRCVDELITTALIPNAQPSIRKEAIEFTKSLIKYKYYSKISASYQEKLASLYELNNDRINAAGIYSTIASKYERNLKNNESKSLYINYLSKIINLLQNEINWKNPFLSIGYTGQVRSIKGLPNETLNSKHPALQNILKAIQSAYRKLESVKPGFINSINIALLQYKLGDKDSSLKKFIDTTSLSDTPYNDYCFDILDFYNQQKDYIHLLQFASHLIKLNKTQEVTNLSIRYQQQILPQVASQYVKEKDYTKAFSYFVNFYKTFPQDPRVQTLWSEFILAFEGSSNHKERQDWCQYYINKTSKTTSPDYKTDKTKSHLLSCINHATLTTYDTNKIKFSFEYLKRFYDSKEASSVRDDTSLFLAAKGKYKSVYKLYQPLLNSPSTALVAGSILLKLDSKYGTQASGIELANSIILQQTASSTPNKDLISLALVRLSFIEIENQEKDKVKDLERQILSYKSSHPEVINALTRIKLAILDYDISDFLDFDLDSIGLVDPEKMLDTEYSKYNKIKSNFDSVCSKNSSIYCPGSLQSVLELTKKFSRRIINIDQSQISASKLHDYKTKKFKILNTLKKVQAEYENKINSLLISTIIHPTVTNNIMFASSGDFNFYPISSSNSYGFISIPLENSIYVYELGSNRLIGTNKKSDYFSSLSRSNKLSSTDKILALILARQADVAIKTSYSYMKTNPQDKNGLQALFLSLLVTKRYLLAGYYAELYQKYYPATPISLNTLAISKITSSYLDKADIETTKTLLGQALKINGSDTVTSVNLLKVHLETGEISKILPLLTKIGPSFYIKPLLEVQADIIYKKLDHALSLLKDYLKQNPKNIEALYKKAVVTQLQGNRIDAVKQLKSLRQKFSSSTMFEGRIDSLLFRLEERGEVSL